MEEATNPWLCRRCNRQLALIDRDTNGRPRLIFESDMLPSLIRDALGFIEVECPRCGEIRKWHKTLDLSAES